MADLTMATETSHEESSGGHAHLGWALVLISIAQLMVVLDATIANIALPFIGQDLDITGTNLTWIVTGYSLAFGGLLLLGGRLGDLYGRRRIFMIGLTVFAVASLLGGLAQSEALLLSARGLQGLGAALASPAALALITTTFPAGPARNRAFAVYAAMSGAGAAVGLILGGWLTGSDFSFLGQDVHGWRMTFLINVPIGIIAALAARSVLAESERHAGELDVPGAITATAGLLAVVFGLTHAGNREYGWGDTWTIVSLAGGAALLAVFVFVETRVKHPMLPFRIFANQTRAASFLAMMLMPAAMFSMFFFLSQYIQGIIGYSPLKTGFAFLPFSIGIIVSATIVSNLVNRIDARYIAGIGTLMASVALYGFSRLSADDSAQGVLTQLSGGAHMGDGINYWTQILPFIVLMALGMGAVFVPLTLTAVHHVRSEDSGIGSGVLNTMQQIGGALGLAVLSTIGAHYATAHGEKIGGALAGSISDPQQLNGALFLGTLPEGATAGFFYGTFMMLGASLIIWLFLNVKHTELATDGPEAAVHVA